jgi:uncharacterized protein (TIRG00374 family)
MRWFMLAMAVLGAALLVVIIQRTDMTEVWALLARVGWAGSCLILALYLGGFFIEAAAWLVTLTAAPLTASWVYRLWKLLMVGTAFEYTVPAGGLGGEPVKAILLKQSYGIAYPDSAVSLVLQKTTDVTGQLVFIAAGLAFITGADVLTPRYQTLAASGLLLLTTGVILFFLAQRHQGASRLGRALERGLLKGTGAAVYVRSALDALVDVERRLIRFYRESPDRFAGSVGLNLLNWFSNGLVVWAALYFLGRPSPLSDAIIIEAFVILVRSSLFFVPGYIGTQEAAYVLICGSITGSAEIGLALATIRRARDLLWIAWGLLIASTYSLYLKPRTT